MSVACAIPPLDQRYARVVAVNGQGLDMVAFGADRRPTGGRVVSPFAGTVRLSGALRFGYLNPVVIEVTDPSRSRPVYVCISGLAFGGRASSGTSVQPGTPIGTIAIPERTDYLRSRAITAGTDPMHPYINVQVWTTLTPMYDLVHTIRGNEYRYQSGALEPVAFWRSVGLDLVGRPGSQQMLVRAGSPADCGARS